MLAAMSWQYTWKMSRPATDGLMKGQRLKHALA
jgi:hypothetical protein